MVPPCSIAFADRQRVLRVDRRRLARLARSVLTREKVRQAEISVAIVDDAQIHSLNREFLSHDFPTDVITFLLDGDAAPYDRATAPRPLEAAARLPGRKRKPEIVSPRAERRGAGKTIDGEIVISAETARRSAREYGTTPAAELALYLVHGLLHLCGYDDRTPQEKRLMRRREAEALREWTGPPPQRPSRLQRKK
ncbi:MAG: rRNA maturation RNase YbeY [Deltaproteobacteria bacterium]